MDDADQGSRAARGVDETGAGLARCRPEHPTVQLLATVLAERYSARHPRMDAPNGGHQQGLEAAG